MENTKIEFEKLDFENFTSNKLTLQPTCMHVHPSSPSGQPPPSVMGTGSFCLKGICQTFLYPSHPKQHHPLSEAVADALHPHPGSPLLHQSLVHMTIYACQSWRQSLELSCLSSSFFLSVNTSWATRVRLRELDILVNWLLDRKGSLNLKHLLVSVRLRSDVDSGVLWAGLSWLLHTTELWEGWPDGAGVRRWSKAGTIRRREVRKNGGRVWGTKRSCRWSFSAEAQVLGLHPSNAPASRVRDCHAGTSHFS